MRQQSMIRHLGQAAFAIAVVVATYFSEPAVNQTVRDFMSIGPRITAANGKAFRLLPFTFFLTIRTAWYLAGLVIVQRLLNRDQIFQKSTPVVRLGYLSKGIVTGIVVMVAVIMAIAAFKSGDIEYAQSDTLRALGVTAGWLGCSLVGAAAEEVFYRGMVLVTLDRFVARPFAVVGSAFVFSLSHMSNPGASKIWLFRLFIQGLLLAWAVARTGSLWWSIGYHAGWNFASAPLLGAVESGYSTEGHLFSFVPTGPVWLTGGDVGPEGSVLAFLAMTAAAGIFFVSTRTAFRQSSGGAPFSSDSC